MDPRFRVDDEAAVLVREELERELAELRPPEDLLDVVGRRLRRRNLARKAALASGVALVVAVTATGTNLALDRNAHRSTGNAASPSIMLAGYTFHLPTGFRQGPPPTDPGSQSAIGRQAVSTTAGGATVSWGVRPWNPKDVEAATAQHIEQGPLAGRPSWLIQQAAHVVLFIKIGTSGQAREIVLTGTGISATTLLAMANDATTTAAGS